MERQTDRNGRKEGRRGDPRTGRLEGAGKGKPGSSASIRRRLSPQPMWGWPHGEGVTRTTWAKGPGELPEQGGRQAVTALVRESTDCVTQGP